MDKLERLTSDEQERHDAWMRERVLHDEATFLREAREDGLREGLQEAAQTFARQLIDQLDLDDAATGPLTSAPRFARAFFETSCSLPGAMRWRSRACRCSMATTAPT